MASAAVDGDRGKEDEEAEKAIVVHRTDETGQRARRRKGWDEEAAAMDCQNHDDVADENGAGGAASWRGHPSVEAQLQMLMQERMQKQQELERFTELARVQKMAVVRKVASEIQKKCRVAPY